MSDEYSQRLRREREEQQTRLRMFPSVLYAVGRYELPLGTRVRVGGDGDVDIRLEAMGTRITIEALADGFCVDDRVMGPSTIDAGRYALRLSHQRHPAFVLLDREARIRDVELRWYEPDATYRVFGRIERDVAPLAMASTASAHRQAERVGWFLFVRDGELCRLAVTRLLEPGASGEDLDVYFRDATTGHGSYEVGRYARVELDGGMAVVDFNLAYNPSCALSPWYNCPIPPPENVLAIPVRAGEKTPLVRGDAARG